MPKGRGFRDKYLETTLASALVSNKAISRGIRLTNGIVVNFLHVISFCNVLLISHRMAITALRSRMGTKISVRIPPTTLQRRLVLLILPPSVFVVERKVTYLIIVLRRSISKPPRSRTVTRRYHTTER
jgi:hypothetical protein